MPILMLSPCGTSTLTNNCSECLRSLLNKTADYQQKDLDPNPELQATLQNHIQARQQALLNADRPTVRALSAELNGILSYYQDQPPHGDNILLASSTFQGQATAQLIQAWLQAQSCTAWIETIPDLNVSSAAGFRLAMIDLVRWAEVTLPAYKAQNYKIVFNLTGGFKSVNGFLQTLGMFYADECIYIFQGSQELLRIPRLPIKLDPEAVIGDHLQAFRRLSQGSLPRQECLGIPETFLFEAEEQVTLSAWGELIWQRCKSHYYRQRIWDPLSQKLRFGPGFLKTVNGLAADRIALINHRLDQLSFCLESQLRDNPSSLDFKKLRGNPRPPSTHECDAWSDLDAKRLFGHFEGDIFILDALGDHL